MALKVSQQYNDHDSTNRRHKTFPKNFYFQLEILYMR